jgi:hypothetical protein
MKNTLNGFLIIMCLVGVHLFAQQVSNHNLNQYAKQKYPERFLPKDEFETTAKYNQRLKHQVEIIDERREELLSELKAKKAETERLEKVTERRVYYASWQ